MLLALNLRIAVGELPPVLRDLSLDDFARSLLVTIPVLCFALAAFAGPPLSARIGEERGLLVMCGALCVGITLRPWWGGASLFAGTVLCGLAVAVMNVMMPSVLRQRFPSHLGEMTAAYTMALSIGAGLAAGFTVPLVRAMGGSVATALAVWAIPAAVASAVWLPQIRRPLPVQRPKGSSLGLLRDAQAWQITLFFGLQSAVFYTLLSWLPTIYRDHGTSPVFAGAVLSFMAAVGIAGNFTAPLLANRFGMPRLAVLTTSGLTLVGLAGVLLYPTGLAFVWATLMGVGTAGTFSVTLLLMASRGADAVVAARLSSMAQGIGYLISALGPLAAGVIHAATHGWDVPLLVVMGIGVAQLVSGIGAARQRTISA